MVSILFHRYSGKEREEFLRGFEEACDVPSYDPDEDDLQELPWRRPWDWLQGAFVLECGSERRARPGQPGSGKSAHFFRLASGPDAGGKHEKQTG